MSLMLTLDDAMKVLLYNDFIDKGYIDEDGDAECVRNELEQKCYPIGTKEGNTWFDEICDDINLITSTAVIAHHIDKGDLKQWLECCRDNIIGELTTALKKKEE